VPCLQPQKCVYHTLPLALSQWSQRHCHGEAEPTWTSRTQWPQPWQRLIDSLQVVGPSVSDCAHDQGPGLWVGPILGKHQKVYVLIQVRFKLQYLKCLQNALSGADPGAPGAR
jgi:hypothetical protein